MGDGADYFKGLEEEIERAHAWQRSQVEGGQSCGPSGDFCATPVSALKRLEWWLREMKKQRDREVRAAAEKMRDAAADIADARNLGIDEGAALSVAISIEDMIRELPLPEVEEPR